MRKQYLTCSPSGSVTGLTDNVGVSDVDTVPSAGPTSVGAGAGEPVSTVSVALRFLYVHVPAFSAPIIMKNTLPSRALTRSRMNPVMPSPTKLPTSPTRALVM